MDVDIVPNTTYTDQQKADNRAKRKTFYDFVSKLHKAIQETTRDEGYVASAAINIEESNVTAGIFSTIYTHMRKSANTKSNYNPATFNQ